ncbi:DUF3304 domain-containing protein [Halomonas dongshanensis]|uniref:DUF3304 domain-containing protein n=1 Tax=Halomonas dongshanensis TaxID=2890835 RepID=A0ABT2E8H1_9GAMM|nr:DUF3304 domain-containing protein [Halomonas dongshanensis]MCS2607874.1 DUF3304 domain-containing protein [Halomonas dongshanensis]
MIYSYVRRYISLIPFWIWTTIFGIFIAFSIWLIFHAPKFTLVGHNHTHNPVVTYWVHDNWGGNKRLNEKDWDDIGRQQHIKGNWDGWHGMTCCWSFRSDSAEILWYVDVTTKEEYEEYEKIQQTDTSMALLTLRPPHNEEEHTAEVTIPERSGEDRYLHVHFLPDNEVKLGWSPNLVSPYAHLPKSLNVTRYQE